MISRNQQRRLTAQSHQTELENYWIEKVICKNYKILSLINKGSFGLIYLAIHQVKMDYYAAKVVPKGKNSELAQSLRNEAEVLFKVGGTSGFPRLYYFVQDATNSYIVQTLLGKNMHQLLEESPKQTFSLKTVLLFMDQAISRLETLHQNEFTHRDIKPENFVFGLDDNLIYLIDFGFAEKYMIQGKHIPKSKSDKVVGTPRFLPICSHLNITQNRSSDLESLGYVAVYFLRGSLPWMHLQTEQKENRIKVIGQKKMMTTIEDLCNNIPKQFEEYFRYLLNVPFEGQPNYSYLRGIFKKLYHSMGFPEDNVFDWNVHRDTRCHEDQVVVSKQAMFLEAVGRKSFTADVNLEELPQVITKKRIQQAHNYNAVDFYYITDLNYDECQEFEAGQVKNEIQIMRQHITFQQNQQGQFGSAFERQFTSNSSNANPTGRFGDDFKSKNDQNPIRAKQMTFQPDNQESNIASTYQYNGFSQPIQRDTGEIIKLINQKVDSPESQKSETQTAKKASANYFQNSAPKEQSDHKTCIRHGQPLSYVCAMVGCSEGWLCEKCEHDCPNIQMSDDFKKKIATRIAGIPLEQMQLAQQQLLNKVNELFSEIRMQLVQSLYQMEELFMARVISDSSTSIALGSKFIRELLQCNLNHLNGLNDVNQVAKLIVNDYFKFSDLQRVLIDDQPKTDKKFLKLADEMKEISHNFIRYIENTLRREMPQYSDEPLNLLTSKGTVHAERKKTQNQMCNIKQISTLRSHQGRNVVDICCLNNNMLATASSNGEIIVWKLPQFTEIWRIQHGIECIALAACNDDLNNTFLLSAGRDSTEYQIYLWNIELRCKAGDVIGHTRQLRKIVSLPNQYLAWCQEDSAIRIWSLNDKAQVHELNLHSAWINDMCRITQTLIASCSRDYTVAVIDFQKGEAKYIIKDVTYVNCLQSLTPELFAFANYNGYVKVYNTEAPILIQQIQVFSNWVDSNCIWYLTRIQVDIIAASSANGEVCFIRLGSSKDSLIHTIQLNKNNISEVILWEPHYKMFLATSTNEIKVLK